MRAVLRVGIVGLVALVAGCGGGGGDKGVVPMDSPLSLHKEPESIVIPLQQARNLYATVATIARDRMAYAQGLCKANKLPATTCLQLVDDGKSLQALDFEIKKRLDNPKAELDVDKIVRILEVSAKLISAAVP